MNAAKRRAEARCERAALKRFFDLSEAEYRGLSVIEYEAHRSVWIDHLKRGRGGG